MDPGRPGKALEKLGGRDGSGRAAEVRRRLGTGGVPSVAELARKRSLADLDHFDHLVCWSILDFMIKGDPEKKKFAAFLDQMKGRLNQDLFPDPANLTDVQRAAIKEIWGVGYPQFEAAWRAFVAKEYPAK